MMVNFPDPIWARLASIADTRGVKIADLIVASAQHVLDITPERCTRPHVETRPTGRVPQLDRDDPAVVDRIRELRAMNQSVKEIAQEFKVSPAAVKTAMLHLHIPTNSRTDLKESNAMNVPRVGLTAKQTHCMRGHEFTYQNTIITKRGKRRCRECTRIVDRQRPSGWARQRARAEGNQA